MFKFITGERQTKILQSNYRGPGGLNNEKKEGEGGEGRKRRRRRRKGEEKEEVEER